MNDYSVYFCGYNYYFIDNDTSKTVIKVVNVNFTEFGAQYTSFFKCAKVQADNIYANETTVIELQNDSHVHGDLTVDDYCCLCGDTTLSGHFALEEDTRTDFLDLVYPVGSIYMSVNETSPATFIDGTWERIQDRFLLSAGSSYAAGTTGGSANKDFTPEGSVSGTVGAHTLTTDEMPSHTHTLLLRTDSNGCKAPDSSKVSKYGTDDFCGTLRSTTDGSDEPMINHGYLTDAYKAGDIYSTGGGGSHSHGFAGTFTGTKSTIDVMPPYLAVYVWKRTA